MKITLLLVAALSAAGCVSQTKPVSVGPDTYMIGGSAAGLGLKSKSDLMRDTITSANAFCAAKGQIAQVQDTRASGIQAVTPLDTQVTFKCVAQPN